MGQLFHCGLTNQIFQWTTALLIHINTNLDALLGWSLGVENVDWTD